ncbi:MAG: DNA polymerase/3'-5' exonuclease PolX [Chlamydiota bacterium]
MKNRELARILDEVADIMEIHQIRWKPRAYRQAARKIQSLGEDIEVIYHQKGQKGLEEISSIGSRLAEHIADYLDKGKVEKWEQLRGENKKGLHKLLKIRGLGPKKVKVIADELDITDIRSLKKAIKDKRLRKIEGFGAKTEKKLWESIKHYQKSHERMLLSQAWQIAREVIDYLCSQMEVDKIDVAGSLRRMQETVGDIDILAVTEAPQKLMEAFVTMPEVKEIVGQGETKTTVILKEGAQIDLRAVGLPSYGSALQYFTGSRDHSIALRKVATEKGYKLSEYGLHTLEDDKKVAGETEEEIYAKLGLEYIPPELRENNGEIEAARERRLPTLVNLDDIKGDFQMHTRYSDGHDTVKDMARKAKELGYEYIAITDHSKSEVVAHGMDIEDIKRQWKEIEEIATSEGVKILKGAEVDILPDGSLDYDDDLLAELDVVLVAVHSGFQHSKRKMTTRILKALDNKHVNILAHPTGRRLRKRLGYKADYEKIFAQCHKKKVVVEINSDPERLDLNPEMIRQAKQAGILFSLGTDAHSRESLKNMWLGVGQARRGWLEKDDIINAMDYSDLIKIFNKEP